MVLFVITLRHPQNVGDAARAESLLATTLHSLCSQVDADIRIVVVANAAPARLPDDRRVAYHVVDFAAPFPPGRAPLGWGEAKQRDKGTKLVAGILAGVTDETTHIVPIDADDWVDSRVANFVSTAGRETSWYADAGYFVSYGGMRYKRKYGLSRYCGSSLFHARSSLMRILDPRPALTASSSQEAILAETRRGVVQGMLGEHRGAVDFYREHGLAIRACPLRAVAWVIGTGENEYKRSGGSDGVRIDARFCRKMGLPVALASADGTPMRDRIKEAAGCVRSFVETRRRI